ncbi:hypothetical protein [Cellulosilyticum ruminicola]|uniref:hypothetical protein n=1 Tax=Cellulosilyticum ruminicola TaxID=425254 RepID=UPI0006CF34A6|nr:hypothetical protein [Cellulosilyticum ruminicola]
MNKMMSILERYKLVEKDDSKPASSAHHTDEDTSVTSSENVTPFPVLPEEDEELVTDSAESTKEDPTMQEPIQLETPTHIHTHDIAEEVQEDDSSTLYAQKVSIEDIYLYYNLGDASPTDTVFLLENLINALPAELPEFVKKTTLDNIAKASAIDVNKLLSDGERRNSHLNHFINDFTTSNLNDIANLKQKIEELSTVIANYHQQIKYKELLIQEEHDLVGAESNRITNILEFFKK